MSWPIINRQPFHPRQSLKITGEAFYRLAGGE